ncbi:MAG: type II toxin-antitoxin system RelB/DinJ family antitoxin [Oscillospiraceae bacterium]|nr:type II toxin-antitoxin system RelB/DinJ family antitoxin [Oscillospiraceae bacterium]
MATTRISVNIDKDIKQNAQRIFGEMGLDMTTAIELFLRTAIIEGRIPFEIRTERAFREATHAAYIYAALEDSVHEANDPNTKWLSQDEMKTNLAKRRDNRANV